MGLIRQSVHPMESPRDEYEHESMTQNNRIADQTTHPTADSPRGSDVVAAATLASPGGNPPGRRSPMQDAHSPGVVPPTQFPDLDRSGDLATWAQNKSDKRLVFADETGGVLADITYSNRTHYSKQAGTGALPGAGRACCVIS